MKLRELFEASKTAVFAFGRMNPPTIGHKKLVDVVAAQAGDPYIFLSQSQKPKTDPLDFPTKLKLAQAFFPNVTVGDNNVRTIIQALQKVESMGYDSITYVAGSDRVASFEKLLNDYNGKEYNFNSIKVVSAGERDPDADGAEGMSASKMRAAAAEGDLESFKQGVPQQEVADEMYAAVRQGMGIKDAVPVQGVAEGWKQKAIQQALIVYNTNKAVKKHKEKEAEKRKSDEKQVKDQGMGVKDAVPAKSIKEENNMKVLEILKSKTDVFLDQLAEAATSADAAALTQAVKDFQTKAGIDADGKVGPVTRKAMQSAIANTAPAAEPAAEPAAAAPATAPVAAPAAAPAQPYTSATTNNATTAAIAKGPSQNVQTTANPDTTDADAAAASNVVAKLKANGAVQAPAAAPQQAAPQQAASQQAAPQQAAPAGTKVSNQQASSNTTKQGNTTTTNTTASANIQGLDMGAARKTPEYQRIYQATSGKDKRMKVKAADMKYRNEIAKGTIKAAAPQQAATTGSSEDF